MFLAVVAAEDVDTCAASPGSCTAKPESDRNTLLQTRVRIDDGLEPEADMKSEDAGALAHIEATASKTLEIDMKACRAFPKQATSKSNCPNDAVWLRRMKKAGDLVHNSFMNVGCNTGVDAVRFLELWGNKSGVMAKWKDEVNKHSVNENAGQGACGQNVVQSGDQQADRTTWSNPKVLCVEPGPANSKILADARRSVFGDAIDAPFTVVQAAGSDSEGTGYFGVPASFGTGDVAGSEVGRLSPRHAKDGVLVRVTTVDKLISEHQLTGLDGLVIDAECHDYSVLAGATNVLRTLRYLVFEVSQHVAGNPGSCPHDSPSDRLTLFSRLQILDAHQFDCYWAGNNGHVQRLTGCWKESDDKANYPLFWLNVVCVKRGDVWHPIFEELDIGI